MAKVTHIKPEWFLKRKSKPIQKSAPAGPIDFLFVFWPTLVQILLFCAVLILSFQIQNSLLGLTYLAPFVGLLLIVKRFRWRWSLVKYSYRFIKVEGSKVRLFYDPSLGDAWEPPLLIQDCEQHLQDLSAELGVRLHQKVTVFYFAAWKDISRTFGRDAGGLALTGLNAMLIASDTYVQKSVRHELTHLLTAKWNSDAPPILTEGLARWMETAHSSRTIHSTAQAILLNSPPKIESLLERKYFYSASHRNRCYTLAASFTGFLIRRYGWERYQKLYRHSYRIGFRLTFKQLMGIALETAEAEWRNEIVSGRWSKQE